MAGVATGSRGTAGVDAQSVCPIRGQFCADSCFRNHRAQHHLWLCRAACIRLSGLLRRRGVRVGAALDRCGAARRFGDPRGRTGCWWNFGIDRLSIIPPAWNLFRRRYDRILLCHLYHRAELGRSHSRPDGHSTRTATTSAPRSCRVRRKPRRADPAHRRNHNCHRNLHARPHIAIANRAGVARYP